MTSNRQFELWRMQPIRLLVQRFSTERDARKAWKEYSDTDPAGAYQVLRYGQPYLLNKGD